MERLTVQIYAPGERLRQHAYQILAPRRPYFRGTDRERLYLDFLGYQRMEANLAVVNLNLFPGIRAQISGE